MRFRSLPSLFWSLTIIPAASAAPITYTLTGYLQGNAQGTSFNTSYTWVITADTSGIFSPNSGILRNPAITSTLTLNGFGSTQLSNTFVTLNTGTGAVTFGTPGAGGTGFPGNVPLKSWDLASAIGPINNPNGFVPGVITASDGTPITITGATNPGGGPAPSFQATTAPIITSVENAASQNVPGLPNAGIAQGAIFLILGYNLGPSTIAIETAPFQHTTFSDTSVAVTVGNTTVNALMYYTAAGYVSALLPSNTPTGKGTITVTYKNQTSATAPITVVANNLGVFTYTQNGQGIGIVTFADYTLVSAAKAPDCGPIITSCGAANPRDTLILWATGLGPVSGSDAAGAGLGVDMTNIPIKVWLGNVQAPVIYRGRSGCCIGEDQIAFTVPDNAPTGCAVPLVIQINDQISNGSVIAIANGSRTCTPVSPSFASVPFEQTVMAGPARFGSLKLHRKSTGGPGLVDVAKLEFLKIRLPPEARRL